MKQEFLFMFIDSAPTMRAPGRTLISVPSRFAVGLGALLKLLVAVCSFVTLAAGAANQGPAAAPPKPNILIIVADDLGFADVGFNGGKVIATPNLDKLAATGVVMENFRTCPMCSPTRAGMLTGKWPLRFGMMRAVVPPWSSYGLPSEENTLPELLARMVTKSGLLLASGTWAMPNVNTCRSHKASQASTAITMAQ